MPTQSEGNGRVTMALLGQKLDYIAERLEDFCEKAEPRIQELEKVQAVQGEKITQLKTESRLWLTVNSLGAVLAGVFGYNK